MLPIKISRNRLFGKRLPGIDPLNKQPPTQEPPLGSVAIQVQPKALQPNPAAILPFADALPRGTQLLYKPHAGDAALTVRNICPVQCTALTSANILLKPDSAARL